jgi:hypothetical protein
VTDSPLHIVPSTPHATVTDHAGHPPTPPATRLPVDPAVALYPADGSTLGHDELIAITAAHLSSSAAWAALAEEHLAAGRPVDAYAAARTGYHRGLDQLRRSGWRGAGPVPWSHEPNRGWLRAVAALGRAADGLGEDDEAARCAELLAASDPEAVTALA